MKIFSEEKAIAIDYWKGRLIEELKAINNERHSLINHACEIWIAVSHYENELRLTGFNFDTLERFYNKTLTVTEGSPELKYDNISLSDKDREVLLIKNIKQLCYIYGVRIPRLNRRSFEIDLLLDMDYWSYNKIRECINEFFSECVLRGDVMNMSNNLGTHLIRYFEYPEGRTALDKGMTFKRIKELKAQGKTLYSSKNPNGEQFRVYFDDAGFYFWQWNKSYRVHNQKMYSFRTYRGHVLDEEEKENLRKMKTVDEIIHSDISIYRKMIWLALNTDMKQRYQWNGTLYNKERSAKFGIEGDRATRFRTDNDFDYSHLTEEDNPYGL